MMPRMVSAVLFAAAVAAAATIGYARGASAQQATQYGTRLTGADIGFQLLGPDSATGMLMIRINGNWVPAKFATRVVPAK